MWKQPPNYAEKCDATESHIIIFDRSGKANWKEQVFTDTGEFNGYQINLWGMWYRPIENVNFNQVWIWYAEHNLC